ncbi:MAG: D-aminoacylase [Desulfovibrio sp.]|jgi:N-acyl-D-amino-acid deacylase|nr:D-aminoacylase [Desulfovibrio sp.]
MRIRFDNAQIYDGTGSAPFRGSVLVDSGRIAAIVRDGSKPEAGRVIDTEGLALSPGFIDAHGHTDLLILEEAMPWAKLRQGVTTEIFGQDGLSLAPLPFEHIGVWRDNLAQIEGRSEAMDWKFRDTAGYLDLLEKRGIGINAAYLVPHGNLRLEVMGMAARVATDTEIAAMGDVLQRELDGGGIGLSTGLLYLPSVHADVREMTELCKVAARNKVPFAIHQRSEGDGILASMEEAIAVARGSGVHLHFSHFKLCGGGRYNEPLFPKMLRLIEEAEAEGIPVTFDQYPYAAGSTLFGSILPPFTREKGIKAMLEGLRDPAYRRRVIEEINAPPGGWDNFVAFCGLDGIFIANVRSAKNRDAVGKNMRELGEMRGACPLEAAMDLIVEEENNVTMIDFYGKEEQVEELMRRPEMCAATDGLLLGTPHPRAYNAYARFLGEYVRERKVMPLEQAVRKMTAKPAEIFAIPERGQLREGYFADIVAFDPATVKDIGTFADPRRHPQGIALVMVNGAVAYGSAALLGNEYTAAEPAGKIIRNMQPKGAYPYGFRKN